MKERRIWWHWQDMSKEDGGRLPVHGRAWLYVFAWKFHIEWHLWSRSCHLTVDLSDDGDDAVLFGAALPPISFYFGVEFPWKSWPRKLLPERPRTCGVSVHDWAIWIQPWVRSREWNRSDPWWVRGVTFHIDDFVLGRTKCDTVEVRPHEPVVVRLDGHEYHGEAKFEQMTWKRPRWFSKSRVSTWISMNPGHGLPHSGKGESEWNCGDDALCGWGVDGIDVGAAIAHGIATVGEYRHRYGCASKVGPQPVAAASHDEDCYVNETGR